jgi:hypothetical protein
MNRSFASLKVNYMTIPVYFVGAIALSIIVYYSDKLSKRGIFIVSCCVPVAVGYLMCVGSDNPNVGYAGMFVLVLGKLCSPLSADFSDILYKDFTQSRRWR